MTNRRTFVAKSIALAASGIALPIFEIYGKDGLRMQDQERPPQIDPKVVSKFVGVSHSDITQVKELVEEYPNLLNSAWDWGGGDFETGFGAAGHVGNKEIANYLIDRGARFNIFVMTMLGKTNLVKPILEEYPHMITALGPHGFTLLHHAERGGDDSLELYEFLQSQGMTEKKVSLY